VDDLGSTVGIVAIAAGGVAIISLILVAIFALRLRRLGAAQSLVLGERGERDVVAHARELDDRVAALSGEIRGAAERLDGRLGQAERRLDGAIAHFAVVRYDAYNEMSGQQSSSIALLDEHRSGVVLSSILHREQARLYAKQIVDGRSELDLSPEEEQAVRTALAGRENGASQTAEEARPAT
jgi:uncharacterized protein DUF4446